MPKKPIKPTATANLIAKAPAKKSVSKSSASKVQSGPPKALGVRKPGTK